MASVGGGGDTLEMAVSAAIRVLIVDDQPVFREALAHALAAEPGFEVVAQCHDGQEAIDRWPRQRPDVTLMDVSMYGIDGIETMRQIIGAHPQARILMLTSSEERQDLAEALEAGAAGYVTKTVRYTELLAAIRKVHEGGRPIDEPLARRLACSDKGSPLSHRELCVLELLREGLAYQEIGARLSISKRTARAHVAAIKEKLDATTAAQCVARGCARGLLRGG